MFLSRSQLKHGCVLCSSSATAVLRICHLMPVSTSVQCVQSALMCSLYRMGGSVLSCVAALVLQWYSMPL